MVALNELNFQRIANYFRAHKDEVISEAWLVQQKYPEAQTNSEFLYKKLRQKLIDMAKSGGMSNRGGTSSLDEMNDKVDVSRVDNAHFTGDEVELQFKPEIQRAMNPLDILIRNEDQKQFEAQFEARIESLGSIDKARVALVTECRNGNDFRIRLKRKVGKRQANYIIKNWCEEYKNPPPPPAQASLFN